MKIIYLGEDNSYESSRFKEESKKYGHEFSFISINEIQGDANSLLLQIEKICEKNDVIISRLPLTEFRAYSEALRLMITQEKLWRKKLLSGESYYHFGSLDKFTQLLLLKKYGLSVPKSWYYYGKKPTELEFPFVFKYNHGRRGEDVFLINNEIELTNTIEKYPISDFLCQELLSVGVDYRVLILDSKVLGFIKRVGKKGVFVTNIHAGGKAEQAEAERIEELSDLAVKAAEVCRCEYAGVDIMYGKDNKPYILEVNQFAAFAGFEEANPKINVAGAIVSYLEKKHSQK